MNLILKISLVILSLFVCFSACETTEPPEEENPPAAPPDTLFRIILTDSACTEAWIEVKTENVIYPRIMEISLPGVYADTFTVNSDTSFYFEGLLPQKEYALSVLLRGDTLQTPRDTLFRFLTMDTTSHDFTWEYFEFGDEPGPGFQDVVVVDENNIWAVGYVLTLEEGGYNPYNAAHWNGSEWKLKQIYYKTECQGAGIHELRSIIILPDSTMIVTNGATTVSYKGNDTIPANCGMIDLLDDWIVELWGDSRDNIYATGGKGTLLHYNGSTWKKIETGTDYSLGAIAELDGVIFIGGSNYHEVKSIILKQSSENNFETFITGEIISENELFSKLYGEVTSLWFDEIGRLYAGGNLFYQYKNNKWGFVESLPENSMQGNQGTFYRGYIYSVEGNASNDIVISGDRNTLIHFNGSTWQHLGKPYSSSSNIIWESIEQKGNTIVAVGSNGYRGCIIHLKR